MKELAACAEQFAWERLIDLCHEVFSLPEKDSLLPQHIFSQHLVGENSPWHDVPLCRLSGGA